MDDKFEAKYKNMVPNPIGDRVVISFMNEEGVIKRLNALYKDFA